MPIIKYRYQSNGSLCCSSPRLLWESHRCPHFEETLTQTDFLSSHRWGHKSRNTQSNHSMGSSCSQLKGDNIEHVRNQMSQCWTKSLPIMLWTNSRIGIHGLRRSLSLKSFQWNRTTWTNVRVAAFALYLIICAEVSPFLSPTAYSSSTAARAVTPSTPPVPDASNLKKNTLGLHLFEK